MNLRPSVLVALTCGFLAANASAAFHVMKIEELIGGVGGNTSAQAIQLQMPFGGQPSVSSARVLARDAAGNNPILLLDLTHDVSNSPLGARILLASPTFNAFMAGVPNYHADFTLANNIPASYLNGGRVTFEDDFGTIYWSLAFGAYTGSNTGSTTNDSDGNFGAPFPTALPTAGFQGIRFKGATSDLSTTNFADYALSPNPGTVVNNDGNSFTVVPEPTSMAFIGLGALALGGMVLRRRRAA